MHCCRRIFHSHSQGIEYVLGEEPAPVTIIPAAQPDAVAK